MSFNSSLLDNFCGSTFWNNSLTWDTDHPEFTPCFQKTVLVWVPCLYLWLATLVELYHISSSRERNIPWNKLNFSKMTGIVILALLQLCNILVIFSKEDIIHDADYYDPLVKLLTFILSGTLVNYNRKYGIRTSGVLFLFWAFLITAGVPQLHSEILHYSPESTHRYHFASYIVYYVMVVLMFILSCYADLPAKDSPYVYNEKQSPELNAGFLSKLTFTWFDPLVWTGYKRSLTEEDRWPLNPEVTSKENVATYEKYWQRAADKQETFSFTKSSNSVTYSAKDKKRKPISVLPVLFRSFGGTFMFSMFLKLINDLLNFVQPMLLKHLIGFVEGDEPMWTGYLYAIGMFTGTIVRTALLGQHFMKARIVSVQVKNALNNAVYTKVLTISNAARKENTVGEITNLMSTDISRFGNLTFFNLIWSAPMQIALALYFLWGVLGPSVLAGVAVILVLMPLNGLIARYEEKLQTKMMQYKDERIKLMTEVLNGIKVLKMYAWEPSFQTHILKIRAKELNMLKRLSYFNSISSFIYFTTPFLVSLMSFTCFVLVNDTEVLDSKRAFVALSLFNILRFPMSMLPNVISDIIQLHVSIKRLNKFLNAEDLDTTAIERNPKEFDQIVIESGHFTWGDKDAPLLKNINLRVPQGILVAVVGAVGSGKSSLISALLGEMEKVSGRVNIKGNSAYVAQQAWIQNATIQDNITFGEPMIRSKYDKIVDACALTSDLGILPAGDQTEIGEKGINLSGGQKQRVSLARAVYYDADNYFLDDPLSAVDSHVGKHIFDKVIGPSGLLKNKTRVWVTHNVSYLSQTDLVVVLRDGEVSEAGSYQQLLEKKGDFADFLLHHLSLAEQAPSQEDLETIKQDLESKLGAEFHRKLQWARSLSSGTTTDSEHTDAADHGDTGNKKIKAEEKEPLNKDDKKFGQLIDAEKTETGNVKWSVYKHYISNIGILAALGTVVAYILLYVVQIGTNFWLAKWSSDNDMVVNGTVDTQKRDMYLGVYGGLGIAQAIMCLFSDLLPFLACWRAAKMMHALMLENILKAPLHFFDVTPIGRIVSRFSSDVDTVDNSLPWEITGALNGVFEVLGIIFVISYSTPLFLVGVLPLCIVYCLVQRLFVRSSRQLARLHAAARSPLYSHFSETVLGATTIRAFTLTHRFVLESQQKVDNYHSYFYMSSVADRWMGIRLELVGAFLLLTSALCAVIGKDNISPGLAGLSISYTLEITKTLRWLVLHASEVETDIVAVERMMEYAEVEQEASWNVTPGPRAAWPEAGALQLERLTLAYRAGEPTLRDVTCAVAPRDKLGIVGRTGAGKSTLTLGLFRILEPRAGRILVDGLDVTSVGLHQLRQRITLIPQDPVLFSGTLRSNLDPFEQHSDDDVWRALTHAHLRPFVQGLAAGLRHEVAEGGENLSVGQRQLVCLARALLRKTPLLVLDEATAAVDLETDELIQKTIRSEFASCTVLTIAHRLNTIMDSTKVMVLDKGQLVEFAPPAELLKDKNSIFYGMAKEAGLVN